MEHVYGVWAVRSAASMFGHAEAWCKEDGRPLEFESLEAAQAYTQELNRKATVNVRYFVKEKEPEPNAVRVPASQPDIETVVRWTVCREMMWQKSIMRSLAGR